MTTAKRLTDADITALIESYRFETFGTLTICLIHLTNGALVTGESRPISDENFNTERGQEAAFRKAREKIWELEGYATRRDNATAPSLHIGGFTIGYYDDGSAWLQADNRPGDGVSVQIDHLIAALSELYTRSEKLQGDLRAEGGE